MEKTAVMNIQFGLWNSDTGPVTPAQISRMKSILDRFPCDGQDEFRDDQIYFLHRYSNADKEIRQPVRTEAGCVLCWDGRLDNTSDLADALGNGRLRRACDVELVGAAHNRWGTQTFSKLIGDWALSLWNPNDRTLILARDFLGTRSLYYSTNAGSVSWSSLLDPLILAGTSSPFLDEEYIAGWFCSGTAGRHSKTIGSSTPQNGSSTETRATMNSISARYFRGPSRVGCAPQHPCSRSSAAAWILVLSCVWPTGSYRKAAQRPPG
jgi:Glutamine amidotransferase domain